MILGKIKALALAMMVGATAFAQTAPNRVIITDTDDLTKGYVADRVKNISFATVEGEVAAQLNLRSVALDKLNVDVKRTPECRAFRIAVIPESMCAAQLNSDLAKIRYVELYGSQPIDEDFDNGELSGFGTLSPGSKYRVVAVGYDKYGVGDGVSEVKFTTQAEGITGNPEVATTVTDRQLYSFTVKFAPNSDVSEYYVVAGEKGTIEAQYDMFAAMFGYNNINEMIAGWGIAKYTDSEETWNNMNPNTVYEVFIAMKDADGHFANHQVIEVSTLELGGPGEATVTITPGDYSLASWDGEMLPSLDITYTPNDQASCYRFGVYLKTEYDKYPEETWRDEICKDPDMPMAYWFFYEPLTTDYQINPSTEIVALAAAKNVNGEWGPLTVLNYTTPAECGSDDDFSVNPQGRIPTRILPKSTMKIPTNTYILRR